MSMFQIKSGSFLYSARRCLLSLASSRFCDTKQRIMATQRLSNATQLTSSRQAPRKRSAPTAVEQLMSDEKKDWDRHAGAEGSSVL